MLLAQRGGKPPSRHWQDVRPLAGGYLGEKEYGAVKVLKDYFDPDGMTDPGGTLGLYLPPEEKEFLNTRRDYR